MKNSLFKSGLDLIPNLVSQPNSEDLHTFFKVRVAEWPHTYIISEFNDEGLFDALIQELNSEQAFDMIPLAIDLLYIDASPQIIEIAISLLSNLAYKSDTTQLPKELNARWQEIETIATNAGLTNSVCWDGLKRWYRK